MCLKPYVAKAAIWNKQDVFYLVFGASLPFFFSFLKIKLERVSVPDVFVIAALLLIFCPAEPSFPKPS